MSNPAEAAYRQHLSGGSECLEAAFNAVLPPGDSGDPSTRLVRGLCFESAQCYDSTVPAFSEAFPYMLDHGVRQAAMAIEVFADKEIQGTLPKWFDREVFLKALTTADAGLAFVSPVEVAGVHEFGPKYAQDYTNHPLYGYEMAQALGPEDRASHVIASFAARHHMVQARNTYGLNWSEIDRSLTEPSQVDLMVALQKPFDYFDDYVDRGHPAMPYRELVAQPIDKFVQSIGQLLCTNLQLLMAMEQNGFPLDLPNKVIMKIQEVATGDTAMGMVYREMHAATLGSATTPDS